MSERNISPLIAGDKYKYEYIYSDQVVKNKVESCINDESVPNKINQVVRLCTVLQEKNRCFCN